MTTQTSKQVNLPRDPFAYIGFWQLMTFIMLLLLIWVNELRGISDDFFGGLPDNRVIIRGCVLSAAVLLTAAITIGNTYLQQKRVLGALISVCAECHRVRLNEDTWEKMEDYVSAHSLLQFSHGLCPACMAATMQEIKAHHQQAGNGPAADQDA